MVGDNRDKLQIRLHVYDADVSVTVMWRDEEHYRKAVKLITNTINTYASVFKAKRSEKDILYMASVGIALRYKKEFARNGVTPYSKIISQLTSEVEEALED